jgi:hypothetical protein
MYHLNAASVYIKFADISSKYHIITSLVIVDLQTVFYVHCICMFIIYFHTKFCVPYTNCLLVIAMKPKAKKNVCMATILLFQSL